MKQRQRMAGFTVKEVSKKPWRMSARTRAISSLTIILVTLIAVAVVVAATLTFSRFLSTRTIEGSRNLITKTMDFSDFTTVDVGGGFKVEITKSSSYSIRITADNNTLDYIDVFKTDNALTIGLKGGYSYRGVTLRAEISMPDLYAVTLSAEHKAQPKNSRLHTHSTSSSQAEAASNSKAQPATSTSLPQAEAAQISQTFRCRMSMSC